MRLFVKRFSSWFFSGSSLKNKTAKQMIYSTVLNAQKITQINISYKCTRDRQMKFRRLIDYAISDYLTNSEMKFTLDKIFKFNKNNKYISTSSPISGEASLTI